MSYKVTVLGCGNSTGIPAIGNYWGACDPNEPKNKRLRSSILVEKGDSKIVVDTGPDFRQQLNRHNIRMLDGILYTHSHSDHVNGIDELRVLRFRAQNLVPIYGNAETLDDLAHRFDYLFSGGKHTLYPPIVQPHIISNENLLKINNINEINFIPYEQDHGTCVSIGYRFGNIGYSVDMRSLNSDSIKALQGIETWIVDCAAYHSEAKVHANIKTIYELNQEIQAKTVHLTSLSLNMDYQTLRKELKPGYYPSYDGLVIIEKDLQ